MPVNQLQVNAAKDIFRVRLLTALSREQYTALYRSLVTLTPKGFRGSLLKKIDFPTSWAVLYGLSPAQISQNREAVPANVVFRVVEMNSLRKALMWRQLLLAYFAGNPEPMAQEDFPSWRKPSWMSEPEKQAIDQIIRTYYTSETPLATTMPVEEVSADDEVIAEMSAGMDGEEETVVVEESSETTSPNVRQADLFESIYALYGGYFRTVHGIEDAERLQEALAPNGNLSEGNAYVRKGIKSILVLEKLGFEYIKIQNFLAAIINRGFQIAGVRVPRNSNFGAYAIVDLKAFTATARRYTSRNAYLVMQSACRAFINQLEDQFNRPNGRGLQIFRFSGRGSRMVGVQLLSLNYMNADFENNGMTYQEAVTKIRNANLDAREAVRNAVSSASTSSASSESTTEAQQPTGNSRAKYEMLGAMQFRPQMTFRSEGDFIKRGSLRGRLSVVFYFVTQELSSYPIYRVVWGEHNFGVNGMQYLSDDNLTVERIKEIWNASGKLRRNGVIKLQRVTNAIEAQNVRNAWITHSRNESPYRFKIERYDSEKIDVDFSNISPMTRVLGDILRQDSLWTQGAQAEQSGAFVTKQQMINASKESFDQLTYAFELEAYVKQGSRQGASDTMNSLATNIDGALKFTSGSGRTLPVNEGQYSLVYDGSITTPNYQVGQRNRADEGFQGYEQAEIVSPVLFGKEGLNKIKYFCEIANEAGVRVNSSDGLHVHFDAHQRSPSTYKPEAWQLASLMYNYHVIHPVIDKYQNLGRALKRSGTNTLIEGSQWAKDFSSNQLKELKQFAQAKKTDYKELYVNIYGGDRGYREWSQGQNVSKYHQSRYRTVNIHASVSKNGTIEMRQGSPSTDYLYIQNWVQWMYYLIIVSKSGVFEKPRDRYGSSKYNEKVWTYCELFLPDNVASYITNTMYLVDGENIDMNRTVFGQRARIE